MGGREKVVITGGGGYFGCRLGAALAARGHRVLLLDLTPPPPESLAPGVDFLRGDVTDERSLDSAFAGADCVFHTASFGMSGREQLKRRRIEEVNVGGTEAVLRACVRAGVPRLVYTSTYNVVFGGQVIENGDESLPYLPLHQHPDHYSRTKAVAEMAVLRADGTAPASPAAGAPLRTCALRPAGIYGPGERRHLPRVVGYIERGLFAFVYGRPESRVDFVHVDNLVDVHVLAADALRSGRGAPAGGQAYFVSDGRPVNNFEFFRPLVEGLGYKFPRARLPLFLVYAFAFLTEVVHAAVGWAVDFQPLLTRTEVYKTGVTHHFSVSKARRELGYDPAEKDFGEVVEWFRQRGHGKRRKRQSRVAALLRDLALVAIFVALLMAFLPMVTTAPLDS